MVQGRDHIRASRPGLLRLQRRRHRRLSRTHQKLDYLRISASRPCGCFLSIRLRLKMTATISPTTPASTLRTVICADFTDLSEGGTSPRSPGNHGTGSQPYFRPAPMVSARPARTARGRARQFYVWSETPDRYRDARIIFKDFESSNWSWDPWPGHTTGIGFTTPAGPQLR